MLLAEALWKISDLFSKSSMSEAGREAQELVLQTLQISLSDFVLQKSKEISREDEERLLLFAQKRARGEPLAYLVGFKDFYKNRFYVNQNVLIPRGDTEVLVAQALQLAPATHIVDLGCGSGCIGLSLLYEWPQSQLTAIDISPEALEVAKKNAQQLGLTSRVQWRCEDVLRVEQIQPADLIVANPPYIDRNDPRIEASVKMFEPSLALFADDEGLYFYKQWTLWAQKVLTEEGSLLFEVGAGQAPSVTSICLQNGFKNIKIIKDLSNIERVVWARRESYG